MAGQPPQTAPASTRYRALQVLVTCRASSSLPAQWRYWRRPSQPWRDSWRRRSDCRSRYLPAAGSREAPAAAPHSFPLSYAFWGRGSRLVFRELTAPSLSGTREKEAGGETARPPRASACSNLGRGEEGKKRTNSGDLRPGNVTWPSFQVGESRASPRCPRVSRGHARSVPCAEPLRPNLPPPHVFRAWRGLKMQGGKLHAERTGCSQR